MSDATESTTAAEPPVAPSPAEELKNQGNAAFAAKQFDEAIDFYTKGIALEPNNPVFYSNRSACYFSKKQFQEALEDALMCVDKDAKFIKGYLRLASAQMELGKFDDAETTLKAALMIEPTNGLIGQKIKDLRIKKATAMATSAGTKQQQPVRQLTEEQRKELADLQEQHGSYMRDLRGVVMRIGGLDREKRTVEITASQIQQYPTDVKMYKAVGKAYVLSTKSDVEAAQTKELELISKNHKDLLDRKEYLERRIASSKTNLQDLSRT